jgi:hypothetical protein
MSVVDRNEHGRPLGRFRKQTEHGGVRREAVARPGSTQPSALSSAARRGDGRLARSSSTGSRTSASPAKASWVSGSTPRVDNTSQSRVPSEIVEERGLPDPRLTTDDERCPLTGPGLREESVELIALTLAPDEWRGCQRGRGLVARSRAPFRQWAGRT